MEKFTEEQKLHLKLEFAYEHCKANEYKKWETITYMQSVCNTDTQTVTNYLIQKENDTEGI